MKTTSGLFAIWLCCIVVGLGLCSCAGITPGSTAGGTGTGGGTAGNTGGSGGNTGGGGGAFANRHFVSTVYSGGQELDLALDSSNANTIAGTISVHTPGPPTAAEGVNGSFDTTS